MEDIWPPNSQGYPMAIPRGLEWSEVASRGRLETPGNVGAKCPDYTREGRGSGGLDVPDDAAAGQPGISGSSSVAAAATMPGKSTGDSGIHAARP